MGTITSVSIGPGQSVPGSNSSSPTPCHFWLAISTATSTTRALYYTSKFFFGPSGTQFPQQGYAVASARAQWTDPSDVFTFALWCDNLADKRYLQAVQYNSFGLGANWSSPRTYGIELIGKF